MASKPEDFARPVAQEKDRNLRAWLIFFCLICFGTASWLPLKRAFWRIRNRAAEQREEAVERLSDCFVAIAYEGVAKEKEPTGRFTTLARFKEHLEALRDAGYHPISLKNVRDFYLSRRPLPKKAVLVTFENTHKSTYFDSASLLRRMHWHATMGVVTKSVREWDSDSLLAPYLKIMDMDATWDLACESDGGVSLVPSDPFGAKSLFFSSPQWLGDSNRYESVAEFSARVEADHDRALKEFAGFQSGKPIAFFFPSGNYGQYGSAGTGYRKANIDAVTKRYPLAFLLGKQALNDMRTDPHRLNRWKVPPDCTGAELVRQLDMAWPVLADNSPDAKSLISPERWIADWGRIERSHDHITLSAVPSSDPRRGEDDATGGARAWIAGSNGFTEGMFDMRFVLDRGEFHVYLRYAADDDYLRIAIADTGRVSLGRCSPGLPAETLAEGAVEGVADFRSVHRLVVSLRDEMIWVRLDGRRQFGGPVALGRVMTHGGLAGAGVWDAAAGLAQVRILEANLRTRLDGIATWPSAFSRDTARLSRALAENAWRFSVVAPPWLDVWGGAPVATDLPENRSLHIVARANRASLQPTVALHDAESFVSVTPQRIVEQLRDIGADGVFVDAEDFPAERLADLRSYLATLHNELSSAAMVLTARLPATVQTRISAAQTMAPLVKSRMASDTGLPPPGFPAQRMAVMVRLLPPGPDDSAGAVAQIEGAALDGGDDESADSPAAMLRLRALGIKAYADGDYAEAVEYWRQWASHDAENPEASAYLGNAWNRMRDTPRAIEAYRKSLDIEPGQIDLALELARLYETAGRDSEGAALLDAYARAYPDNRRVSVAQALWLDRHGSRLAGRAIVRKLVDDDPTDIQCRLTLQTLLDSPSERYANMHELLSQVSAAGEAQRLGFGRDIAEAELLTIPESTVFFDFIRDAATNSVRDVVRKLYSGFLPFSAPVTENFGESRLSDRWISFGTPLAEIAGTYDLKAAANMSEAYLRLKQSELLRDGFIEVVVGESVGAFWLYARRSSRNMVRFGFDGDGFLRIQTWSDGEPRTVDSKPWVRPAGDLTLRLEIRGDGAVGHVNGKRVFSNPLPIPSDIAYGWWSVAPFSPELGIARARISRISAGPLAPAIAMLRETDGALAAEALDRLRVRAHEISAVAPVLFVQHPDGTILDEPISDLMPFRMFCSYHRLRLMPVVSLDFHSDVRPQVLVDIILKHRFSGLVLMVRSLPSEEWFREATALIEKTSADLVVVQSKDPIWESGDPAPEEEAEERLLSLPPVTMRELERGSLLLPPVRMSWSVPITPFGKWSGAVEDEETTTPSLVVLPRAAAKAAENPEAVDTQAPRE